MRDSVEKLEKVRLQYRNGDCRTSTSRRSITTDVIPIAIRLARGERIALAPAVLAVNMKSLFKLVQVWIWERFSNTRPNVREIPKGEPRISRWDSLQQRSYKNEMFSFDGFDWRPYTKPLKNWNPLRVSQLAGNGFVENYYPNRVAMQFGLNQDLPGLITRHVNFTEKEAWEDYNKSLNGLKLYMPSCLARVLKRCRTKQQVKL
ncbi:unnamed protein product [Arabis nemorensis]|uniref:Aminotransferase-like plant mobile domain-containing protein n=1 Tax=Arabis nemorensis TaxID=586526 RepID=A0A565BHD7_9BRAS|nr:unnamed protein product [Arabis nemorensis]